ncbi:DUF2336 domain-containing protein [Methylorubrum zatmanii]|uniref:DUF2336 domain-containing protein n=2 Tax=Pseudomonadota TaxID=1224 RepID=A0ABW1WWY8_9HYPH|nr:DUF2336 domain-containing protein [Methylorubrum zatmanii]
MDTGSQHQPMQGRGPAPRPGSPEDERGHRPGTQHPYARARLNTLVTRIEEALRSGDRGLQSQLVLQSAALLTKRWSRLAPPEKPAFDALLLTLCGQIDTAARTAFAEQLADLRLGPPRTSQALARDRSARVAAPLLSRCTSLGTDILADIAASAAQAQRLSITARPVLPAGLTDCLIRHGDGPVAARLLENGGACFSEAGFSGLIAHSARSEAVTLRLATRADLPPAHRPALLELTRARAIDALRHDVGSDRLSMDDLLSQARQTLARPLTETRLARFDASADFVRRRFENAKPNPAQLERWANLNRIEDVLATIALRTGLPLAVTVATFDAPKPATMAALLRGLDHPWSLLKALLSQRYGEDMPIVSVNEAYELHRRLSPLAARRLIRFAALPLRVAAFPQDMDEPPPLLDRP